MKLNVMEKKENSGKKWQRLNGMEWNKVQRNGWKRDEMICREILRFHFFLWHSFHERKWNEDARREVKWKDRKGNIMKWNLKKRENT